jgi:hypothetical protein
MIKYADEIIKDIKNQTSQVDNDCINGEEFEKWLRRKSDMKNEKFKSLVVDTFNKYKESGNLVGILYGAVSTYGFSDISDINGFINSSASDMLYIKSRLTGLEVDVYEYDLVDYTIKESENTIDIKLRNKEVLVTY